MDLGPCNKIHEAALKADFELASKNRDFGYDVDVSTCIKSVCVDDTQFFPLPFILALYIISACYFYLLQYHVKVS